MPNFISTVYTFTAIVTRLKIKLHRLLFFLIMYLQKYILYLFHGCLIISSCEISQRLYFIWILCLSFMLYIILCILCLRFPIFSTILSAHELNTWFCSLVLLFKHNSIRHNYYYLFNYHYAINIAFIWVLL